MTGKAATKRSRWRRVVALGIVIVVLMVATFAGYANYRVNRFTASAFRGELTPAVTQYGADTPTAAAGQAAASQVTGVPPASQVTPTTMPAGVPAPAVPTATPSATPLPYGNSAVIDRLRRGQRVTVLVLGFGGPGHDGGYLTDSIQVVSFDPLTGNATLISVPRDLWVYIPVYSGRGGYWGKINEAYTIGMGRVERDNYNVPYSLHDQGGTLAAKVVAQVIGVPIDYWMSLDFVGFRQFIDALGGVNMNIETAFTDTHYPNNDDAAKDPSYKTVSFTCGPQRLNGERAIEYARSRYSPQDGSDFGRSRRQQQLIKAVKEQTFRVDTIPKVFSLLDAVEGHFHTSFSFSEVRDLAGWAQERARNNEPIAVTSAVLETGNLFYSSTSAAGAYIILPRQGQGEYGAVHRFVRSALDPRATGTPGTPVVGSGSPSATAPAATTATVPGTPDLCGR